MPAPSLQHKRSSRFAPMRLAGLAATVALLASTALWSPPAGADEGFSDVAAESVHQPAINALAEAGVLDGTECGSGLFCPSQPLQRWTAAVWLVRAFDSEPASSLAESRFDDVDADQWWAVHVESLAELGITKGCRREPLRYCPTGTVTRASAASFLARALDLEDEPSAGFVDIEGNTHAGAINALAITKITAGCSTEPYRYCPDRPTTRAQMASLIARALGLVPLPTTAAADTGQDSPDEQSGAQPTPSEPNDSAPEHTAAESGDSASEGTDTISGSAPEHTAGESDDSVADSDDAGDLIDPDPRDGIPDLDSARAQKDTSGTASGYTAVTAGGHHACGLRTDATVVCWGRDWNGSTSSPSGEFSVISAGLGHTCGVRTDGTLACWGYDEYGQADPPPGTFIAVTAGRVHSCGVRTDATLSCWGNNRHGQADPPPGTFSAVGAGDLHTCGVHTDATVACWGRDPESNWGQSDPPPGTFSAVTGGSTHSCGLRTDGTIACWGDSLRGQTDAPSGRFSSVASGGSRSCGLRTDGTLACWGLVSHQPPASRFAAISVSGGYMCGLDTEGVITCWGGGDYGQYDPPAGRFTSVGVGDWHACGLRDSGTIACWGRNNVGQGAPPPGTFNTISVGPSHACGIRTDGSAACWGENFWGQANPPPGTFVAVTAGVPTRAGWAATEPSPAGGYTALLATSSMLPWGRSILSAPAAGIRAGSAPTEPSPAGAAASKAS